MTTNQRGEDLGKTTDSHSRRELFKRVVLLSAAGYVAPKAILISEAWACHKIPPVPDRGFDLSVCP